jgi:UDP-N-acetylglucosamine--N-acetylmuramyl-(pentapeptide) pyrophosphoryl-undecaprenol N-acetylglucosamine transferase
MSAESTLRIVLVVGKTGGHVFPALAVAEAFKARGGEVEILFVCPDRKLITDLVEKNGYKTVTIRASRVAGGSIKEKLEGLANLTLGVLDARRVLKEFQPHAVVGFGSFLTPPMILAARSLGILTAIQEQNSVPGLANRVCSRVADLNFLSFEDSRKHFRHGKSLVVGNPVRADIVAARVEAEPPAPFTLLILGGSQGARFLNTRLPKVVTRLLDHRDLRVLHQTGGSDYAMVEKLYAGYEDRVTVRDFYEDMGEVYAKAHLAICRAGAGVLFELVTVGVPALFIPFPHAAGNHQFENAKALVTHGAGLIMTEDEYDARRVEEIVEELMDDPLLLDTMRRKLHVLANPYAAEQIVEALNDEVAARGRRKA